MWLLIAEMVLALGLIVFIMVWTMRARVDHTAELPQEPPQDSLQEKQPGDQATDELPARKD